MNEAVTKRFLLYFRLMLLVWILIANAIIHVTGLEYSWLIFLSNIMMFTLEGDVKDRFVTVELGGLVGLILTVIALLSITALTPVLGSFFGFLIPLGRGAVHPHHPAPLRTQGAEQRGLCLPDCGLHRHHRSGHPPAPVLHHLHRGFRSLQRRVRAADEACQGSGRQERPEGKRVTLFTEYIT